MKVYDFKEKNAHIVFDSLEGYDFTSDLSINFLFQLEKWPTSWTNILQKKKNDYENEFCFRIKNQDVAHWYYGDKNEAIVLAIDIKKYLKMHRWNKVTLIRKNKEYLKVYINGELAGEKSIENVGCPQSTEAPLTFMEIKNNNINVGAKIAELEVLSKCTKGYNEFSLDKHLNFLSSIEGVTIKNSSLFEKKFRIKNTIDDSFEDLNQFDLDQVFNNGSIDSIEISDFGRFGNSVKQFLNCMIFAEYYKIKRVYIPKEWYLKNNKAFIINGFEVILKDENTVIKDRKIFVDKFFYIENYFNALRIGDFDYRKAYTRFKDITIFKEKNWNINRLDSNELVVYFRSGDIFHRPHPRYGQPPLSFYKKIVNTKQWYKVYCVYQDKSNPVIQPFIDYVSNLNIEVEEISGSLEDDINFLLRAVNLVAAPGTFTWSISLISENLKNLYYFNRIDAVNFSEIRLNEIKFYDRSGHYVRSIMSNNWKNSVSQRDLMLAYSEDEILLNE